MISQCVKIWYCFLIKFTGDSIMTVLLAIAVKPFGDRPYFLMGSDSLRLIKQPIYSDDNEFLGYEEDCIRIENSQKIFRINDKLVGMTGRFNFHFTEVFLNKLQEQDCEIEQLAYIAANIIKEHLTADEEILHNQRITVTMGSCNKGNPKIAYIEAETDHLPKVIVDVADAPLQNAVHRISGNTKNTKDLEVEFINQISKTNLRISTVRKYATKYLKMAAERNSETCNQNIVFERLF